jgi:hypothetical protein
MRLARCCGAACGDARLDLRDAVDEVLDVLASAGRWGLVGVALLLALYVAGKAAQRFRLVRSLRMARVSVNELNDMMAGDARPLIIDVRSLRPEGRIPARWIDSNAFVKLQAQGRRNGPRRVIVCACPNEVSARRSPVDARGFTRVRPLAGGIEA